MRRAIALSAAGLGATSPNPPVGCVILSPGDRIVGEGYHERKGGAHAEVHALSAAGPCAEGATAVVTLEPCNHYGRTPPCRQALIDSKVKRVVIAVLDPTSRGEGGAAALRNAGVDVELGVLADEARTVLGAWLTAQKSRRPIITWPYVLSPEGLRPLLGTGAEARALRLNADVVIQAGGTISEAVSRRHGQNILDLERAQVSIDARATAAALYDGGVRQALLLGGLDVAEPFLSAGLVDYLLAHIQDGDASRRPGVESPWPLLPPGFSIRAVTKLDGYVRVAASAR